MAEVARIPTIAWKQGYFNDGTRADYQVAETVHTMNQCTHAFRLVVKRTRRRHQADLFNGNYHYWIIATNIPEQEKDAQAIIHFHNGRWA